MICKVLTQLGYTNRLIYKLLTVRLATACCAHAVFYLHAFSTNYLVMELVEHAERVNLSSCFTRIWNYHKI